MDIIVPENWDVFSVSQIVSYRELYNYNSLIITDKRDSSFEKVVARETSHGTRDLEPGGLTTIPRIEKLVLKTISGIFFSDFYGLTEPPNLRYVVTVFGRIKLSKIVTFFFNSAVFEVSILKSISVT